MTEPHPLSRRRAGMLCHLTSIPATGAYQTHDDLARFVDFIADAGVTVWQVLPLNPPDVYGSPYCSPSLHAYSPALAGDLDPRDVAAAPARFAADFDEFRADAAPWLRDYLLFVAIAQDFGSDWTRWPEIYRRRDARALATYERTRARSLAQLTARQFTAWRRWRTIKRRANERGVIVLGDTPLYPAHASADVWANPPLFALGAHGELTEVAGVPPDYFSATGQRWGNPVYAWEAHGAQGFAWWIDRVRRQLGLFDVLRIDHFRGLESFWSIPAAAESAIHGRWQPSPGHALLSALSAALGGLPLVAEDLGTITPEVHALRTEFALPGMRVLQFAFSGDAANPHLPANFDSASVAYTGTHDNDTTKGWLDTLPDTARPAVLAMLGETHDPVMRAIEIVLQSVANTAIVPLQDWLGLGSRARMNTPGERDGNWQWRCARYALTSSLARVIRERIQATDRLAA